MMTKPDRNWFQPWILKDLRPRVAHSLPGRLRLRIAALKCISQTSGDVTQFLEQIMEMPTGIRSISLDSRSGSLLIRYNPEQMSESEIIHNIKVITRLTKDNWNQLRDLDMKKWKRIVPKLKRSLADATDNSLILKNDFEI